MTARGCGLPARADAAIALPMNGNVTPAIAAFPNPFSDIRSIHAAHPDPSRLRRRSPLARLGPSGRNGSADQPPVSARSSALESVHFQPASRRVLAHRSVQRRPCKRSVGSALCRIPCRASVRIVTSQACVKDDQQELAHRGRWLLQPGCGSAASREERGALVGLVRTSETRAKGASAPGPDTPRRARLRAADRDCAT